MPMHTNTYTHACTNSHAHAHTHMPTCTYSYTYSQTHLHTYPQSSTHTPTCMHRRIHTGMFTHTPGQPSPCSRLEACLQTVPCSTAQNSCLNGREPGVESREPGGWRVVFPGLCSFPHFVERMSLEWGRNELVELWFWAGGHPVSSRAGVYCVHFCFIPWRNL